MPCCQTKAVTPTMCWSKQFRRIATRYEKLARNFFGMLSLACAYIWLA